MRITDAKREEKLSVGEKSGMYTLMIKLVKTYSRSSTRSQLASSVFKFQVAFEVAVFTVLQLPCVDSDENVYSPSVHSRTGC